MTEPRLELMGRVRELLSGASSGHQAAPPPEAVASLVAGLVGTERAAELAEHMAAALTRSELEALTSWLAAPSVASIIPGVELVCLITAADTGGSI